MAEKIWRFESSRSWQELGQSFQNAMRGWKAPLLYRALTRLEIEHGPGVQQDPFGALNTAAPPRLNVVAVARHSTSGGQSSLGLRLYESTTGTTGTTGIVSWNKGIGSFAKGLDAVAMASLTAVDPAIRFTRG